MEEIWKLKSQLTFIRLVKNPLTDITISIPMNNSEMYWNKNNERDGIRPELHYPGQPIDS